MTEKLFLISTLDTEKHKGALIDASIMTKDGETASELLSNIKNAKERKLFAIEQAKKKKHDERLAQKE